MKATATAWIDLYWIPLGAGGHLVRFNGRVYERLVAASQHRAPSGLYHCALQLHLDATTYAIEMGPVWNVDAPDRGAVCEGPVGARCLGRFRAFRYELRCWPGGCSSRAARSAMRARWQRDLSVPSGTPSSTAASP